VTKDNRPTVAIGVDLNTVEEPTVRTDYTYVYHCRWCDAAPVKAWARYCSNRCRWVDASYAIDPILEDCVDSRQAARDTRDERAVKCTAGAVLLDTRHSDRERG
jgi:hypothetical protein